MLAANQRSREIIMAINFLANLARQAMRTALSSRNGNSDNRNAAPQHTSLSASKKGMGARELLKYCWPEDRQASKNVSLKRLAAIKGQASFKGTTVTHDGRSAQRQHEQTVKIISEGVNPKIKVSCTCARHKFVFEYALHRQGAADIIHSNGEPPRETNPDLSPGICKHVRRVLENLVKLGKL